MILLYTYIRARVMSHLRGAAGCDVPQRHWLRKFVTPRGVDIGGSITARLLLSSAMIARLPPPRPSSASILTHTKRCPAGESILSPRAAATATRPHTPPGEARVLLLLCAEREACRCRCG